jgi:hexosaminidase
MESRRMSRRITPVLFATLAAALLGACATQPHKAVAANEVAQAAPLPLMPLPAHIERHAGTFAFGAGTRIVVPTGDETSRHIATQLADWVRASRGIDLAIASEPVARNAIVFAIDPSVAGSEAYVLDIDADHVRIAASDPHGLFYGAVTLWQLLASDAHKGLPAVHIEDAPRFAWRGLMLDSARHFQSVDEIKQLIDQMALAKLNTLHWHLTDDQGWRLEIKRYPKLTSIGGCRKAVGPDAALTGGANKPYCGFYTQDEARDVVRYAAERFITVVPEIETPGHAQAAIASYPEFGVTGTRPPVSTDWGVNTWLYNVDDKTFVFLENVLDEVMQVFPSTYIHVGGDEAAKDQWQASKAVQAKMHKLGLEDDEKLQGWFIARLGDYLQQHGRRLIGWDEILDGKVPASATVMSWRGTKGAVAAANQGHDVVLAASPTLYMDYLQSDAHDEQPGRPQVQGLKTVYDFDPVPDAIEPDKAKHVLGAQITVFSEYLSTPQRLQHAIFPRMAALSERTWSAKPDWNGFLARLPAQMARYRAAGVDAADSAFAVRIDAVPAAAGTARLTLGNQAGYGEIHYTIDGSEPGTSSPRYTQPVDIALPAKLRANAFVDGVALAAARARDVDALALNRRNSDQLDTCADKLVLRLEAPLPLDGPRPVYKVDIMNTCWRWKQASLDGISHIDIDVNRLPYNYQLWKDAAGVVGRPKASKAGEVEVRLDSCEGKRIATLPLAPAKNGAATLSAKLPSQTGGHDLCLLVTGKPGPFLWVIGDVQLR